MVVRIYIYIYYPETPELSCALAINICLTTKKLAVTKTTTKDIAGLQDPLKDKFMNGKRNYELKFLKNQC